MFLCVNLWRRFGSFPRRQSSPYVPSPYVPSPYVPFFPFYRNRIRCV
jgi:hypothetical protein